MNIELADFQLKAIADLMEAMECDKKRNHFEKLYWKRKNDYFNTLYGRVSEKL